MLTKPHEAAPVVVVPAGAEDPAAGRFSAALVLGEMRDKKDPAWISSIVSRLLLASSGPVGQTIDGGSPLAARLEAAKWPLVNKDAVVVEASRAYYPTLPKLRELGMGFGSPVPDLVLVLGARDEARVPLLDEAGRYLMEVVRFMGYDELSIYVAFSRAGKKPAREKLSALRETFDAYSPRYLAVGDGAKRALAEIGVSSSFAVGILASARAVSVPDFAAQLRARGLEPGAWEGRPFLHVPLEAGLEWPAPLDCPLAWSAKAPAAGARAPAEIVDTPGLRLARLFFVTGRSSTPGAAAREAGISASTAERVAESEDWLTQRQIYKDGLADKTLEKLAERDSERVAKARQTLGEALQLSADSILERIKGRTLVPSPTEFSHLTNAYLKLLDSNDPTADESIAALRKMSNPEVLRKYATTMDSQWGKPTEAKAEPPKEDKKP